MTRPSGWDYFLTRDQIQVKSREDKRYSNFDTQVHLGVLFECFFLFLTLHFFLRNLQSIVTWFKTSFRNWVWKWLNLSRVSEKLFTSQIHSTGNYFNIEKMHTKGLNKLKTNTAACFETKNYIKKSNFKLQKKKFQRKVLI